MRAIPQRGWFDLSRLTVVGGHYGSGKTEIAVNLALLLAAQGHATALANLDVVETRFSAPVKVSRLMSQRPNG